MFAKAKGRSPPRKNSFTALYRSTQISFLYGFLIVRKRKKKSKERLGILYIYEEDHCITECVSVLQYIVARPGILGTPIVLPSGDFDFIYICLVRGLHGTYLRSNISKFSLSTLQRFVYICQLFVAAVESHLKAFIFLSTYTS